jgi:hypothetical protein
MEAVGRFSEQSGRCCLAGSTRAGKEISMTNSPGSNGIL